MSLFIKATIPGTHGMMVYEGMIPGIHGSNIECQNYWRNGALKPSCHISFLYTFSSLKLRIGKHIALWKTHV
jgi:hypothetical protein